MNFHISTHASERLSQRGIKQGYVDYTLRKGRRDQNVSRYPSNATQDDIPMEVYKSRCHGLVVVYTQRPHTLASVVTAFWQHDENREVFDKILQQRQCRFERVQTKPRKLSERKQKSRNRSWEFWSDVDCM